jgi:hypothetical protein
MCSSSRRIFTERGLLQEIDPASALRRMSCVSCFLGFSSCIERGVEPMPMSCRISNQMFDCYNPPSTAIYVYGNGAGEAGGLKSQQRNQAILAAALPQWSVLATNYFLVITFHPTLVSQSFSRHQPRTVAWPDLLHFHYPNVGFTIFGPTINILLKDIAVENHKRSLGPAIYTEMAWYDKDSWLTLAFAPNPLTIIITLLVAVLLPILVHFFLYKQKTPSNLPSFVLLGPSGSGKTALLTVVRSSSRSMTMVSSDSLLICLLPISSNKINHRRHTPLSLPK